MPQSALLVEIPEADAIVGEWRRRYDPVTVRGVPAHVTVLFPFRDPATINDVTKEELAALARQAAPFECSFSSIGTFLEAIWLAPEPAEPFVAMTRDAAKRFPDYPPYGGAFEDVIPHLTIAMTEDGAVRTEIERDLAPMLPINTRVTTLCLYTSDANEMWSCSHRFTLGAAEA